MTMYGEFPIRKMLAYLERNNLLPGIVFRTSRRQCDLDVEQLFKAKQCLLPPEKQERLKTDIDEITAAYGIPSDIVKSNVHFTSLIATGVGAHHAGQLLVWRLLLEELMTRGSLRLLIATGTVAAGVDFPARSVVVTSHSKRGSEGFQTLSASDFQQMSGRAGRRGKDAVGVCLIAPGPYCDARVLSEIARTPPEPLASAYFASPSTILNLLKFRNVDDLKYTVSKSFASFLDRKTAASIVQEAEERQHEVDSNESLPADAKKRLLKRVRRLKNEANNLESRQEALLSRSLEGLQKLGYLEGGGLSEKGYWAAELCTNLVLELSEAISDGIFDDLDPKLFIAAVASMAGDPHRTYFGIRPNPIPKEVYRHLERIVVRVRDSGANSVAGEVGVLPNAALTVYTWMESRDWSEFAALLRLSGTAEGDAARLITQTADHLNQLSHLTESHPEIAQLAYEGRFSIMRSPLTEVISSE